jgi:hypothetical protein
MIRLFCGYDTREAIGFHVFVASVLEHASVPVAITPLDSRGMPEGSNSFTTSRFLVPYLCGFKGWAIFADACDMLMLGDIAQLLEHCNPRKAAMVVPNNYRTRNPRKYIGTPMECENRDYSMKNWASLMLINCQHPAWAGMTPHQVAKQEPLDLLQFRFCDEGDLGFLPDEWNRLVDEGQLINGAEVLHWTAGIPAFEHYRRAPGARLWHGQLAVMEGAPA